MKKKGLIVFLAVATVIMGVLVVNQQRPSMAEVNVKSKNGTPIYVETKEKKMISVTGTSTIAVEPDTATLEFGVESEDVDSNLAQKKNAEIVKKVMEALKSSGVKDNEMKTVGYTVYQRNKYDNNGNVTSTYYVVRNIVELTTMELDRLGTFIGVASKAGANNFNGLQFSVSENSKYYREALKAAVLDAKSKADVIALASGQKIAGVLTIAERSYLGGDSGRGNRLELSKISSDMAADFEAPISSGELNIRAIVEIDYEIE